MRTERYRWVVLAAGTAAQAAYSSIWFGVAVLAPDIRRHYGLSFRETGTLLAASLAGSILSLVPWGVLADRIGERAVIGTGLGAAGVLLVFVGRVSGFVPVAALLFFAGLAGASVNAASGRAVMHWFGPERRGLALGIRQTAVPIGGFAASLVLPRVGGVPTAFVVLGVACVCAAGAAATFVREGPRAFADTAAPASSRPLRDRRLWLLSCGSAFLLAPQTCVVGFAVLFLHEHRGMAPKTAAAVVAAVQVLSIGTRIGAGGWSDALRSRIVPLRRIALATAALVALTAALVDARLFLLVPVLVLSGGAGMSWNGLSFTAAAEVAGHARSGAAIGFQQTVLSVGASALPPAFAPLVEAVGWRVAFLAAAVAPLVGYAVLGRLGAEAARRPVPTS